jgi:Ca-activated chloride channel family protein
MDWLWPDLFLLLGFIPLIVALYILILRRRSRFAVRYSSLSLIRDAVPVPSWLHRHLPFLLLLFAIASLIFALGRPVVPVAILSERTTIILTLDVSRSMCMRDIPPDRLDAAKEAALSFVQSPVIGTQTGVVAFAGFAELAQPPTTDVKLLTTTIENLTTATETAIGSAILRSLDALAEVDERIAPSEEISKLATFSPDPSPQPEPSSSIKEYLPHIIVLLTDGASNAGPHPLLAAQQAADRGIRIHTIGFGTTKNSVMDCGTSLADDTYLSPGLESDSGGGSFGTAPDEATLKQIAKMTGGEFHVATSAAELQMVFQNLGTYIAMTNRTVEVSVVFAALAIILAITALVLSLLWHPLL